MFLWIIIMNYGRIRHNPKPTNMKKYYKYYIYVTLLTVLISMSPIKVMADEVVVIDNEEGISIEYKLRGDIIQGFYATVLGAYGDFTSITIPPKIKHETTYWTITYEVDNIAPGAFANKVKMTSISIPSTIKEINNAFRDCENLTSVHISDLAAWCNIDFNDWVQDGGIYTAQGVGNPLFYAHHLFLNGKEIKDLVIPDGITYISAVAFWGCTGLTSVTIPNSVKSIGAGAFYCCENLNTVNLPESLEEIGVRTFGYCENLTTINLPENLKEIGNSAFYRCSALTSITIPYSVELIGDHAFQWCSELSSIILGYGNSKDHPKLDMGSQPFHFTNEDAFFTLGEKWEDIEINTSGRKIIVENFDERCINNRYIWIGQNYLYSEQKTEVKDLVIPEGTTSVGNFSLILNHFNSIIIPSTVKEIRCDAFWRCETEAVVSLATEPPFLYYYDGPNFDKVDNVKQFNYELDNCEFGFLHISPITSVNHYFVFPFLKLIKDKIFTYDVAKPPLYVPKGSIRYYGIDWYIGRYYEKENSRTIDKYNEIEDFLGWLWYYNNYDYTVIKGAWWNFEQIVEGIPADISQPQVGKDEIKTIYQIDGTRTAKLHKGVNIIKYSDGTTKKVLSK